MPQKKRSTAPAKALMTVAMALILVINASAGSRYKVLHAFTGGNDGGGLWGSLLLDKQGNVYGTTIAGGPKGKGGTAFRQSRQANGAWSQTVLYNFCSQSGCKDGGGPTADLIFDPEGNLYGTTVGGGDHHSGVAFELTHGSQDWDESILYNFCAKPKCSDGGSPHAGLVMDKAGKMYGTGYAAFELSGGSGGWKETVLHDFTGQHGDGSGPYAVVMDAAGNLYGETNMGGSTRCGGGCGTVYELQPTSGGGWKEHILHDFGAVGDGTFPGGVLILDGMGNLYGITEGGGATGNGTVYRLTPQSDGRWKETILHNFTGGANGDGPGGGVVMDKAGNLYGTTIAGGDSNCGCGVVYKLAPGSNGKWSYTVLHSFIGYDGAQPAASPILDSKGNLYGTTITGGAGGYGVAFEITP
jgi:uncharacterized repeat protein (TIGR03803 family)